MKRLKTLFLMLLALTGSLPLIAQDATMVQKLVIRSNYNYDSEISFLLREEPKITIQDHYSLRITTKRSVLELYTERLDKMMVVSVEDTEIDGVIGKDSTTFVWQGDALMIDVQSGNSKVMVYAADGKEYLTRNLHVGKYILPQSELPKGFCIIKVDGETIKIWNR